MELKFEQISTKYSTAATIIITLSIIAQQGSLCCSLINLIKFSDSNISGSYLYPNNVGGRIIFLSLLMFGLLTYNYFTSSLVTLLLVTVPPVIDTIPRLQQSPLQMGIENQSYSRTLINESTDPAVIEFARTKLYFRDNEMPYYTFEEAIEKISQGGFAYHTDGVLLYDALKNLIKMWFVI